MYFFLTFLKMLGGVLLFVGAVALALMVILLILYGIAYGLEYFGVLSSNPIGRMYHGIVERMPSRRKKKKQSKDEVLAYFGDVQTQEDVDRLRELWDREQFERRLRGK